MPKGKGTKTKSLNIKSSREIKELKSILNNGCVTIVVILADWCGACKRVKPHWLNMLKKRNEKNVVLIDNEELPNTQLRDSLNITHFPSAFEISPGKKPVLLENVSDPESIERSVNGMMDMSKSMPMSMPESMSKSMPNSMSLSKSMPESMSKSMPESLSKSMPKSMSKSINASKFIEKVNNNTATVFTPKEGFTPSLEKLKGGRRTRRNRQKRTRTRRFRKS